jgi:hypothetical protein
MRDFDSSLFNGLDFQDAAGRSAVMSGGSLAETSGTAAADFAAPFQSSGQGTAFGSAEHVTTPPADYGNHGDFSTLANFLSASTPMATPAPANVSAPVNFVNTPATPPPSLNKDALNFAIFEKSLMKRILHGVFAVLLAALGAAVPPLAEADKDMEKLPPGAVRRLGHVDPDAAGTCWSIAASEDGSRVVMTYAGVDGWVHV